MIFKSGQPLLKRAVLSIDCGLNGAICLMTNKRILVEPMPDREKPELIKKLIYELREKSKEEFNGLHPICIIEHVEGRGTDSGYTVAKLTFNYGLCYAYCDGFGMKPVLFHPASWKSYMGLKIVKSKQFPDVEITTAMKKQKTVDLINRLYPWLTFSKPLCDAIALCEFGRRLQLGEVILKKQHKDLALQIKKILDQKQ